MKRTIKKKASTASKKEYLAQPSKKDKPFAGNTEVMVSTGSTLLDLAISGSRVRGGGLPGGILVEAFGGSGTGKTVLLCEVAGYVQRMGGDTKFNDPEARLNKQFASMFDMDIDEMTIEEPDTVTEMFQDLETWEPRTKAKIHGVFTDSLAALSTNMEMENKDGDKMGMRRAKEFSEGFRKFARVLKQKNYLMVCSNQMRVNTDAGMFGQKYVTPGGEAIGFYASVRLRFSLKKKIKIEKKIKGKAFTKTIGIISTVEVFKNSTDAPYRTAEVYIIFDYGVDDIRANLQFLKDYSSQKVYFIDDVELAKEMDVSIKMVEEQGLEQALKNAVINLWQEMQDKFKTERKKKKR